MRSAKIIIFREFSKREDSFRFLCCNQQALYHYIYCLDAVMTTFIYRQLCSFVTEGGGPVPDI